MRSLRSRAGLSSRSQDAVIDSPLSSQACLGPFIRWGMRAERGGGGNGGPGRRRGWGDAAGGETQGVRRRRGWGDAAGGETQGVRRRRGWGDAGGEEAQGVRRRRGWGGTRGGWVLSPAGSSQKMTQGENPPAAGRHTPWHPTELVKETAWKGGGERERERERRETAGASAAAGGVATRGTVAASEPRRGRPERAYVWESQMLFFPPVTNVFRRRNPAETKCCARADRIETRKRHRASLNNGSPFFSLAHKLFASGASCAHIKGIKGQLRRLWTASRDGVAFNGLKAAWYVRSDWT